MKNYIEYSATERKIFILKRNPTFEEIAIINNENGDTEMSDIYDLPDDLVDWGSGITIETEYLWAKLIINSKKH